MFNFSLIRSLPLLLILFLTGCESLTSSNASVNWSQHQLQLQQLTHFIAKGKIRYSDPQNNQSINFALTQRGDHSELRLMTPLGKTLMKLTITPTQKSLHIDGKDYYGEEANALVKHATGLNVPATQLPNWIKGLPTEADYVEYGETNAVARLEKRLESNMWVLDYLEYAETSRENFILPKSMRLIQGNTTMDINLSGWDLSELDLAEQDLGDDE